MDFETKAAYRKSRAPWQNGNNTIKVINPYAAANTSIVSNDSTTLQVPNPYSNKNNNKKNTRRMSVHLSAAAHAHGRSFSQAAPFDISTLPPVPQLNKTETNSSEAISEKENVDKFADIESKIIKELSNGSATEIDDYYKVLLKQSNLISRDIKANINLNQKNILELVNDLKDTKNELLQLRISTKDLHEVLDEFKIAAERRMEIEYESQEDQHQQYEQKSQRDFKNKKDRSSIMVLKKMWASELQSLFKHVEGASKYVQVIPGRHVLAESGRWFEMNVGTWKPTKAAHLFILNDLVLIANKKRSQEGTGQSRLQAVHCWPLNEVTLSEVAAPGATDKTESKVYLINIKSNQLSYIFQSDRYDHFLKITEAFNKGKNEFLQRDRLMESRKSVDEETGEALEEKRHLRDSLRSSGLIDGITEDSARNSNHRQSAEGMLQDISARVHSRNRSHDLSNSLAGKKYTSTENSQFFYDLRRLEDRIVEVDVEIAHNKYTESVGLIKYIENKLNSIESAINNNKNNKNSSTKNTISALDELKLLIDVIKLKINSRKSKIQSSLGFDLKHNIEKLTHADIYQIIEYFYNFNQLNTGISLYLQAMSQYLSSIISRLVVSVQGSTKIDIVNYLSNLVIIHVSIIKRTISAYKECIVPILNKDHQQGEVDSSGLINWCVDEIMKLVTSIKKHLIGTLIVSAGVDADSDEPIFKVKDRRLLTEFLDTITPQLDNLKSVGVNVDYLFENIFSINEQE